MYHIGLDIGSTTIKCVVLDEQQNLLYHTYERHYSHIVEKAAEVLAQADEAFVKGAAARLALSGSAGMGFAESCGIPFVQEVYATRIAANRYMPGTDVVIELGGEDAKILFLTNGTEVRMNGSCAGGTGARQLHADPVGLLRRDLPRLKRLDEVPAQVRALVDGMAAGPCKFNIGGLHGAAEGGHQQLPVRLVWIADIVDGRFQR